MREFLRYLLFFAVLTIGWSVLLFSQAQMDYPYPVGPQFDKYIRKNYLRTITEQKPDIVLLGDSMLDLGVDRVTLADQLNKKVYKIGLHGSASTLWYLILKNNMIDASIPPKYLVVFFRDSLLTVPGFRVQGRYFEQIDEYATPRDKLLIQRAYLNLISPFEKWTEQYFPPYSFRWQIRESIDSPIRYFLSDRILGCLKGCTDHAMMDAFGDNNMDPNYLSNAIDAADDYMYTPARLDFNRQVEVSFLPEYIRLAREYNIQLIFVELKTLRFASPSQKPPSLEKYHADLRKYLAENKAIYIDFSADPRIKSEYFYDPLHFTEEGKAAFTEILAEALRPYVH